jgi:hypothetical protein
MKTALLVAACAATFLVGCAPSTTDGGGFIPLAKE